MCVGNGKSKPGMQTPGSIAAANLPCDDRPSDAAFGHVVFGRNATFLRPLKDPPGMPTEDVLTLLESRILGLSVDRLTTAASDSTIRKSSDALSLRCSDALLLRCTFAQMPFCPDAQMPRSVKTARAVLTDRVCWSFPPSIIPAFLLLYPVHFPKKGKSKQ